MRKIALVRTMQGLGAAVPQPFKRVFAGWSTASVIGGLLLWEFVSRVLASSSLFLAAPTQIAAAMAHLWRTGELLRDMETSGIEFVIGYFIAAFIGIAVGLAMAESKRIKQILNPWVEGLYATPTIALAPLFILWAGVGIWSKVLVVVALVVFPGAHPALALTIRLFGIARLLRTPSNRIEVL